MARQTFTIASDPAALRNIRDQVAATEREALTALRFAVSSTNRWLIPRVNLAVTRALGRSTRTDAITRRRIRARAQVDQVSIWVGLNDVRMDRLYGRAEARRLALSRALGVNPLTGAEVPNSFWVKNLNGRPAIIERLGKGRRAPIRLPRVPIEQQARRELKNLAPATADQLLREFERQLHVQVSRRR